ncbi:hypothetical protein GCM10011385_39580 [Nitratireductor aestuarii]|uniref:Uncharacterized protein n=1 Tax=Nitratireductor aestuarii TaxID=1735103 RepID=A0A916WAJ0_9HYPH|nr:hypothetical protein GCM10011385_39580 [Nitratireductor aestuarii]
MRKRTKRPRDRVAGCLERVNDIKPDGVTAPSRADENLSLFPRAQNRVSGQIAQDGPEQERMALHHRTRPRQPDINAGRPRHFLAILHGLRKQVCDVNRTRGATLIQRLQSLNKKREVFNDPAESILASLKKMNILDVPYSQVQKLKTASDGL